MHYVTANLSYYDHYIYYIRPWYNVLKSINYITANLSYYDYYMIIMFIISGHGIILWPDLSYYDHYVYYIGPWYNALKSINFNIIIILLIY